jgi:hypothetical protein
MGPVLAFFRSCRSYSRELAVQFGYTALSQPDHSLSGAMHRVATAIAVSTLVTPVMLFIWMSPMMGEAEAGWLLMALMVAWMATCIGVVIFGVPIYLACRRLRWSGIWIGPLFGFMAGAAGWLGFILCFAMSLGHSMPAAWDGLRDPQVLKGLYWPGGATGAAVGLVFWLIARPDRRKDRVIKTIAHPNGIRRVLIIQRSNGSYGFEEERFSAEPEEHTWLPFGRRSYSICDSEDAAVREACGRIGWLNEVT